MHSGTYKGWYEVLQRHPHRKAKPYICRHIPVQTCFNHIPKDHSMYTYSGQHGGHYKPTLGGPGVAATLGGPGVAALNV